MLLRICGEGRSIRRRLCIRRKPYVSEAGNEEWQLVVPYPLRQARDLPPWAGVYQQTQRCLGGGGISTTVNCLRGVLRRTSPLREDRQWS